MASLIRVEGVSKEYASTGDATSALVNIDLHVEDGEFLSIMGPSGCGKSTLLNLIAGYDTPSSGKVTIGGAPISAMSERERSRFRASNLGFVVQSFDLIPRLTVEENILARLGAARIVGKRARSRAREMLDRVGVPSAAANRYPGQLSGGEQQRVAMARALSCEPRVLLADEPTGNLDSVAGARILDLLSTMNAEQKMSIVLVTHDEFAGMYGHRTVAMKDGRILHEVGSLAEHRESKVVPI